MLPIIVLIITARAHSNASLHPEVNRYSYELLLWFAKTLEHPYPDLVW